MSRPRRRLRTRLVVAMVAIALGVLLLTAGVTAALARRSEVSSARSDVRDRAEAVGPEFDSLIEQLPAARTASETAAGRRQLRRIRTLVNTTLKAANGAIVAIEGDGGVKEGLAQLLGTAGTAPTLPAGIAVDDLDAAQLLAGRSQEGKRGDTVFLARPLALVNGTTPVVVLAEDVDTRPFGGSGLAVLGAAAISLGVAALVATFLARRMTEPLAAMEGAARSIAGGDLSTRVDASRVRDDELANLADAINAMASDLDVARGHERAFLLSVSHDLRTPLTSIRGYADAIADGTVEGRDARIRAAEVISSESQRLERLVADLLDLARLDAHQFSLHPTPVDARLVVADATEAFGPAAAELGLTLSLAPGEPVPAEVDAQRLAQIVANLVENALKFATSRVGLSLRQSEGQVQLAVEDDGPGIAPADLPHVFERLFTSRTVPGRTLGTGIGLAIVRELALAMGGDARVEPVDAEGTCFVVTFPATVR